MAARRAFVELKQVFVAAVEPLPGRQGDWLRPLVPVMLLGSPLSWRQYMGVVALDTLGKFEQLALALAGALALLIGMGVLPSDNMAPLVQGPLLLVLIWRWYRAARPVAKPADA